MESPDLTGATLIWLAPVGMTSACLTAAQGPKDSSQLVQVSPVRPEGRLRHQNKAKQADLLLAELNRVEVGVFEYDTDAYGTPCQRA